MENNTMMEQTNMKPPKKKNPIGLILLIIILMIGCLIGGYYINEYGLLDNILNKKEVKEEKETKKEEKKSVTKKYETDDPKVAKLIDNIIFSGLVSCNEIEFLANDKKVEITDIDSARAWAIALHDPDLKGETILLEDVNKTIEKYLGKDYIFDPKSMKNICGTNYEYDETTKSFISKPVQGGCGGSCGAISSYKLTKAEDTDGVLTLEAKVIFAVEDKYASDYSKNIIIGNNGDNVDSLYEKGSTYQFIFKEEDGNYIFISAEQVE